MKYKPYSKAVKNRGKKIWNEINIYTYIYTVVDEKKIKVAK